jgi:Cdc6-like AAA superfamily ATPase
MPSAPLTQDEIDSLSFQAGRVYTPTTPIDERALFAGRRRQLQKVIDAISQKGQHAIIFGERGVGKTSLSNVLSSFLGASGSIILSPRVNCDGQDTFDSIWRKVFDQITRTQLAQGTGFTPEKKQKIRVVSEELTSPATPDSIRRFLTGLSQGTLPILIIDEFDRLPQKVKAAFADTIKNLSDHAVSVTVVLVGVADSVDDLISEHQSVERALVQIRMPRMSSQEIQEIVTNGLQTLGMSIDPEAMERITILSQGLPHYTHLLARDSARGALAAGNLQITLEIVDGAIKKALEDAQQSIRSACHKATMSPRKNNLFGDVLLACALAKTDDLGFFAAQDIREPMKQVTGKTYEIPSFAQHLNEFCDPKRGPILSKTGAKRRYRFRFVNPLMQPFVIMQGFAAGKLKTLAAQDLTQ